MCNKFGLPIGYRFLPDGQLSHVYRSRPYPMKTNSRRAHNTFFLAVTWLSCFNLLNLNTIIVIKAYMTNVTIMDRTLKDTTVFAVMIATTCFRSPIPMKPVSQSQ